MQVIRDYSSMDLAEFESTYGVKVSENGAVLDETTGRRFSSVTEWADADSEADDMVSFSRIKGGNRFEYDY